jgi:hypothetical protein
MAKKSMMGTAADAVKTVAGAALGAAAAAATTVVVESVANAMSDGGKKLDKAKPSLEKSASKVVSKPIVPAGKAKSALAQKRKAAVKKAPVKKAAVKKAAGKKKAAPKKIKRTVAKKKRSSARS